MDATAISFTPTERHYVTGTQQNSTSRNHRHHPLLPPAPTNDVNIRPLRFQRNRTSTSASAKQPAELGDVNAEQLQQSRNGGIALSRTESFYSAAAVLTIAGIFVALTMTASLALFVFWRKTNTVFALQKCEQEDYANEDDDSNDGTGNNDDADESRFTESDSDCATPPVNTRTKSSNHRRSRDRMDRWLPVELEDTDTVSQRSVSSFKSRYQRQQSESDRQRPTTSGRMKTSATADDVITMTALASSVSDDYVENHQELSNEDDFKLWMNVNDENSTVATSTTVVETHFSFR